MGQLRNTEGRDKLEYFRIENVVMDLDGLKGKRGKFSDINNLPLT
jgi:hypothetical protein